MKARPFVVTLVVLLVAAAAAAFVLTRGVGGLRPGGDLGPGEQALLRTLSAEQRKDVLARYEAARAAAGASGKKVRLAQFMPETAYSVRLVAATRTTLQSSLDVNGDVTAETNVSVYPDIGGRLVDVRVVPGDRVQKDEVIAQVDPSKPGASYALSPVRAPLSGTVTAVSAPTGSTVTTATPVARVGILDAVEIVVDIRERDSASVSAGTRGRALFEAFPGQVFPLTVRRVSPVLDPASRTRQAVLVLDTPDPRVLPGMFARVRLDTRVHANRVAVPVRALVERSGEFIAYVAVQKDGVDRAELRTVRRGVTVDELTEIVSGIAAGERVVVAGQAALGDGALLRVVPDGVRTNGATGEGQKR
jgi:multidrug efflux pump subunit AcrA (membrane-fusion protein)